MFSYMYDLKRFDGGGGDYSSMGQLGSSCIGSSGGSRRRGGGEHLRRSKSVHLMEVDSRGTRPKSHRFWRDRRAVADVGGGVRLIDLEAALPHSNYSAWCLSFDGEMPNNNFDSVREQHPEVFFSGKGGLLSSKGFVFASEIKS
jgi:hypothetical protein